MEFIRIYRFGRRCFLRTHSARSSEKLFFPRAPNRPSSLSLRRRFHPLLSEGRARGGRGIALESVWTPASWSSPPPPPPTPVAVVDKRRATRDIWIPAMHYNAPVVHPPRERERFRMSESRDAADTEMLSAKRAGLPGERGFSDRGTPRRAAPRTVPRLAGAVSETSETPALSRCNIILMTRPKGERGHIRNSKDTGYPVSDQPRCRSVHLQKRQKRKRNKGKF